LYYEKDCLLGSVIILWDCVWGGLVLKLNGCLVCALFLFGCIITYGGCTLISVVLYNFTP
jgi:hypothetical protein